MRYYLIITYIDGTTEKLSANSKKDVTNYMEEFYNHAGGVGTMRFRNESNDLLYVINISQIRSIHIKECYW